MATGMRNPASESLSGKAENTTGQSCPAPLPHLVLTSPSVKSAHRADTGRVDASLSCAGCCVGSPKLNQGSQACSLFPAALTPMRQVRRAATDRNMHHQLDQSYHHTGNGTQMGTFRSHPLPRTRLVNSPSLLS